MSRSAAIRSSKMLQDARTAGMQKLHCGVITLGQWQVWAAREGDPKLLDFNGFGNC